MTHPRVLLIRKFPPGCSDFVTTVIRPCLHMIGLLFLFDLIFKSCTKTLRSVSVYTIELWKPVHWHMPWWHALFSVKILIQRVEEIVPFTSFGSISYQVINRITVFTHEEKNNIGCTGSFFVPLAEAEHSCTKLVKSTRVYRIHEEPGKQVWTWKRMWFLDVYVRFPKF